MNFGLGEFSHSHYKHEARGRVLIIRLQTARAVKNYFIARARVLRMLSASVTIVLFAALSRMAKRSLSDFNVDSEQPTKKSFLDYGLQTEYFPFQMN